MDFPLRDFLLQIEDNGHYSEDTAVVERIISEKIGFQEMEISVIFMSQNFPT